MTASLRLLAILFATQLLSCNSTPKSAKPGSSTNQPQPIPAKLSWSEPIKPDWVEVPMDSIEKPRDSTIDMRSLETWKLTGSGFIDLAKPLTSIDLDLASLQDTMIDMNKLASIPMRYRTSILGQPKKLKTGLPRLRDGATAPILVYGQEVDLSPTANVHQTIQDADGRLWFAAIGGLTMYDGEYSYVYGIEQGLNSLQPWALLFDEQGRLWCGGYSGIDILDFKRGIIQHILEPEWMNISYVFNLALSSSGKILAAAGHQLTIIDPKTNTLQRIGQGQGLRGSACRSVIEDSKGRIWFGTTSGVTLFEPSLGRFRYVTDLTGLVGEQIMRILEDSRGSIWFVTGSHGAFVYDLAHGELYNIRKEHGLASNDTRALAEDLEGNIYIGCDGTEGGLSVIDPTRTRIRTIDPQGGLPSSYINDLFFDREQQLWMTSPVGGICQLSTQLGHLEYYSRVNGISGNIPRAIMEDANGSIWIGSEGGIDILDTRDRLVRHISLRQLGTTRKIMSITEDSRGLIWIGLNAGGLVVLDPKTGHYVNYGQKQGICNYDIREVLEDSKGHMWVSTIAGVNQFNATRTTNRYIDHHHGLSHYSVIDLIEDRDGKIWFASGGGVDVYDPVREELRHLKNTDRNSTGFANCFLQDSMGRIWIGTDQDGVHIIDVNAGTDHALTMTEGMISNCVRSLTELNGVVYAGTSKGLSTIVERDEGSFMVQSYSVAEGLPFLDFLERSAHRSRNGSIWWGIGSSVTVLKPSQRSTITPRTFISGIDLNEHSVQFLTNDPQRQHITGSDTVWNAAAVTEHKANSQLAQESGAIWNSTKAPYAVPDTMQVPEASNHLTFQFTATRVNDPAQTRYSYIIDGLDESWSVLSDRPYADYRNIPPGDYTFKVKGCGADKHWSEAAVLHFSIIPPWWASAWAYGVYLLSLIGGAVAYLRYRHDKLIGRQRELEFAIQARTQDYVAQKVRAEHSERIKEQFLANMSHEIRTPMNAVIGITNILLKKQHSPEQAPYLESMRKSSEGLLVILNDILDLSKIEAGMITFEKIPFDLHEAISFVINTLHFKAEEKGLELTQEIEASIPRSVIGDPTRLQQILINLVGNAIKFTERGKVRIVCSELRRENDVSRLQFQVVDTGIGMTEDQVSRIFESFTQASSETTRKYGGTGLGLNISRHLVELLGGEIEVTSQFRKGSTFAFSLDYPIATAAPLQAVSASIPPYIISRLDGVRILLAEDNELNRMVTRDTLSLEISRLTLDEAIDGEQAIAMLLKHDYDIILMDVSMPVLDGYAATKRIRSLPGQKGKTPILALTAGVVRTELDRAIAAGMNGYVTKPFKSHELLSTIYHALEGAITDLLKHDEIERDASVDDSRLTDLAFLEELTQGDEKLVRKYIAMYQESTPENLKRMREYLVASDVQGIARTMHQVKTHLKFMGMRSSAEIAERIELLASSGTDTAEITMLVDQLANDCERSFAELRSDH